jgi:hypothetical protein
MVFAQHKRLVELEKRMKEMQKISSLTVGGPVEQH